MELRRDILLSAGNSRHCVAVIILEDQKPETNEAFIVSVRDMGVTARVIILDDDGKT